MFGKEIYLDVREMEVIGQVCRLGLLWGLCLIKGEIGWEVSIIL